MIRKTLSISILIIGAFLLFYGVVGAPISNQSEILSNYDCNRLTKEVRNTDIYCSNPEDAPEAKKDFTNVYVYAGAALIVATGIYIAVDTKSHRN